MKKKSLGATRRSAAPPGALVLTFETEGVVVLCGVINAFGVVPCLVPFLEGLAVCDGFCVNWSKSKRRRI